MCRALKPAETGRMFLDKVAKLLIAHLKQIFNFQVTHITPTGPSTDNQVGVEIIREQMQVEAFNAISHPADLGDHIIGALGLRNVRESKVVGE